MNSIVRSRVLLNRDECEQGIQAQEFELKPVKTIFDACFKCLQSTRAGQNPGRNRYTIKPTTRTDWELITNPFFFASRSHSHFIPIDACPVMNNPLPCFFIMLVDKQKL